MSKRSAQPITIPALTEAEFLQQIIQVARLAGWFTYHVFDSRQCEAGFPDLILTHPTVFTHPRSGKANVLAIEVKTEKGQVRAEQYLWLKALEMNGVETHVWRPGDVDEIIERLQVA